MCCDCASQGGGEEEGWKAIVKPWGEESVCLGLFPRAGVQIHLPFAVVLRWVPGVQW